MRLKIARAIQLHYTALTFDQKYFRLRAIFFNLVKISDSCYSSLSETTKKSISKETWIKIKRTVSQIFDFKALHPKLEGFENVRLRPQNLAFYRQN